MTVTLDPLLFSLLFFSPQGEEFLASGVQILVCFLLYYRKHFNHFRLIPGHFFYHVLYEPQCLKIILHVLSQTEISFLNDDIVKGKNQPYILLVTQEYQFYLLIHASIFLSAYAHWLCYNQGLIYFHLPLQCLPNRSSYSVLHPPSPSFTQLIILACKSNHATPQLIIYLWFLNLAFGKCNEL